MREESHLDEMRDAIRGDFERLAERRGDQDLMRPTEPDETSVEAEEPVPTGLVTSEIEPEHEPEVEPEVVERRSWVARHFST
jgi:hypothetical protein